MENSLKHTNQDTGCLTLDAVIHVSVGRILLRARDAMCVILFQKTQYLIYMKI